MKRQFGGAIWTNHALDRLNQRGLTQEMASIAFNKPDESVKGKLPGSFEYRKRFGKSIVTIIAKQNEKNEWLILSCWIDPPLPGTEDARKLKAYHAYQNAGFWKKVWIDILQALGIG